MKKFLSILVFLNVLTSCKPGSPGTNDDRTNDAGTNAPRTNDPRANDPGTGTPQSTDPGHAPAADLKGLANKLVAGKGSFTCLIDGKAFSTDPNTTKCYTMLQTPLVMLMAKGTDFLASWQFGYVQGTDNYHLNGKNDGGVSFRLGGVTYGTRSVMDKDYIDVKITGVKDYHNLLLLSGSFEGVLSSTDGKSVRVTEGNFITDGI